MLSVIIFSALWVHFSQVANFCNFFSEHLNLKFGPDVLLISDKNLRLKFIQHKIFRKFYKFTSSSWVLGDRCGQFILCIAIVIIRFVHYWTWNLAHSFLVSWLLVVKIWDAKVYSKKMIQFLQTSRLVLKIILETWTLGCVLHCGLRIVSFAVFLQKNYFIIHHILCWLVLIEIWLQNFGLQKWLQIFC